MSHMTEMECEIKDLDALEEACARIEGLTLVRGKKEALYYNHSRMKCDHVIEVKGSSHDIAVVKRGEKYVLQTDFYGNEGDRVRQIAGHGLGTLFQAYNICNAKRQARRNGMTPMERKLDNGTIRVTLRRN